MNDQLLAEYLKENLVPAVVPGGELVNRVLSKLVRCSWQSNPLSGRTLLFSVPGVQKTLAVEIGSFPLLLHKRVVLVGAGMIARSIHVPALLSVGAQIAFVVDKDEGRAKQVAKWCGAKTVSDISEVDFSGIDYAVCCAPTHLHESLVRAIAASGVDCFVEKPLAATLAEALRIKECAEGAGIRLAVGHMRHWDPRYEEIRNLVQKAPCRVVRQCIQSAPFWRGKHFIDSVLEDGAVHDVDLLCKWLGEPQALRVSIRQKDHFKAVLIWNDGHEALIDDKWIGIHSSKGVLQETLWEVIRGEYFNKIWEVSARDGSKKYVYHEKERIPLVAYQGEHYDMLTHASPRHTVEDALCTMRLIEFLAQAEIGETLPYTRRRE